MVEKTFSETHNVETVTDANGELYTVGGINTKGILRKTLSTMGWIAVVLGAMVMIFSGLMKYSNITPMYVVSNSMVPVFQKGDLILTSTKPNEIVAGDIIAYQSSWLEGKTVTHRVISFENGVVATKGDNNESADPTFDASAIVGEVVGVAPKLGYLFNTPVISTAAIAGAILVWVTETFRRDKFDTYRKKWWREYIPVAETTVEIETDMDNQSEHDKKHAMTNDSYSNVGSNDGTDEISPVEENNGENAMNDNNDVFEQPVGKRFADVNDVDNNESFEDVQPRRAQVD